MIKNFLEECRPRMRELVQNADNISSFLPLWKPRDEALDEHISEPGIPDVSGRPSLLLHNLGEEKNDQDRDFTACILNIFCLYSHMCVTWCPANFLYPPDNLVILGSLLARLDPETRLLVEGLCRQWGFYFVAQPDITGIGSDDLWLMSDSDRARISSIFSTYSHTCVT